MTEREKQNETNLVHCPSFPRFIVQGYPHCFIIEKVSTFVHKSVLKCTYQCRRDKCHRFSTFVELTGNCVFVYLTPYLCVAL